MGGLIGLDIDGTVTEEIAAIPEQVVSYLAGLQASGWNIAFITGRIFVSGMRALQALPFPYSLAVQNGAALVEGGG